MIPCRDTLIAEATGQEWAASPGWKLDVRKIGQGGFNK